MATPVPPSAAHETAFCSIQTAAASTRSTAPSSGGCSDNCHSGGGAAAALRAHAIEPWWSSGSTCATNTATAAAQIDAQDEVHVVCGDLQGVLLLPKRRVLLNAGSPSAFEISPTEFERLGGKGRVKKWRMSVKHGE